MTDSRTLTDADVTALVDAFEQRMTEKFYRDLGKGIWGLVWKALVLAALFVAGYGAWKGGT